MNHYHQFLFIFPNSLLKLFLIFFLLSPAQLGNRRCSLFLSLQPFSSSFQRVSLPFFSDLSCCLYALKMLSGFYRFLYSVPGGSFSPVCCFLLVPGSFRLLLFCLYCNAILLSCRRLELRLGLSGGSRVFNSGLAVVFSSPFAAFFVCCLVAWVSFLGLGFV